MAEIPLVLVVDPDSARRTQFLVKLPPDRYTIAFAGDMEQALRTLAREPVGLAVVTSGGQVRALRGARPAMPILLMDRRYADESLARAESRAAHADGFLAVPFEGDAFEQRVREARAAVDARLAPMEPRPTLTARAVPWASFKGKVDEMHARLGGCDYYELLGVERTASAQTVRSAYYALAAEFHPDRFLTLADGELRAKIYAVFKRMSEGFKVLADPQKRHAYDDGLRAPAGERQIRFRTVERPKVGPRDPAEIATTINGRKFLTHALTAEREGNLSSACMYLQLALQHEPTNRALADKLAGLQARGGGRA